MQVIPGRVQRDTEFPRSGYCNDAPPKDCPKTITPTGFHCRMKVKIKVSRSILLLLCLLPKLVCTRKDQAAKVVAVRAETGSLNTCYINKAKRRNGSEMGQSVHTQEVAGVESCRTDGETFRSPVDSRCVSVRVSGVECAEAGYPVAAVVGPCRCKSLRNKEIAWSNQSLSLGLSRRRSRVRAPSSPPIPSIISKLSIGMIFASFSPVLQYVLQFSLQTFDSPGVLSPPVFSRTRKATYVTIVRPCAWRILKPETTRDRHLRNTNRA